MQITDTQIFFKEPIEITVCGKHETKLRQSTRDAFRVIKKIESIFNCQDRYSDLARLNRAPILSLIPVNAHLHTLLKRSYEISKISEGFFDPTVTRSLHEANLPAIHPCPVVDAHANWMDLQILERNQICKLKNFHIDLSGMVQAYAIDCAMECLQAYHLQSASISSASILKTLSKKPTENICTSTSRAFYTKKQKKSDSMPLKVTVTAAEAIISQALSTLFYRDIHVHIIQDLINFFKAKVVINESTVLQPDLPKRKEIS